MFCFAGTIFNGRQSMFINKWSVHVLSNQSSAIIRWPICILANSQSLGAISRPPICKASQHLKTEHPEDTLQCVIHTENTLQCVIQTENISQIVIMNSSDRSCRPTTRTSSQRLKRSASSAPENQPPAKRWVSLSILCLPFYFIQEVYCSLNAHYDCYLNAMSNYMNLTMFYS